MVVKLLVGVDPKKYKLMVGNKWGGQAGKLFGKLL